MKFSAMDILNKLLKNPGKKELFILQNTLKIAIPFNAPHGFKLQEISDEKVAISLPYKRVNFNHLKGIHACGLATLGEFCAGLCLLKHLGGTKYRLILSRLECLYHYQAKADVVGSCSLPTPEMVKLVEELSLGEAQLITLSTLIHDTKGNLVATINSTWQIKEWSKVKTKR